MARRNIFQGIDRDVYQILKKLEETVNDGKPFARVSAVYDAIKRSNSSLARQKKRPLEDSIERVLQFRKEELGGDSDDSEAAIEELEAKTLPEEDRFLLNRQMTKFWHQGGASQPAAEAQVSKKRRIHEDTEDKEERSSGGSRTAAANTPRPNGTVVAEQIVVEKVEKADKALQKKTQKASRYRVEHPGNPVPLGGMEENHRQLFRQTHYVLKWPELYSHTNWRRVPGIILSGPPGIGKRSLVRSLAAELEVPIVSIAGCLEDPERMEKSLTEAIEEAMRLAPSIILLERLDQYMSRPGSSRFNEHHGRTITQFMRQMERIQQDQPQDRYVLALATTSNIGDVDPAALRVGLFERTIQMKIPDDKGRADMLRILTRDIKVAPDIDFGKLAKLTHGFVGADMVDLISLTQQFAAERLMDVVQDMDMPMTGGDDADSTASRLAAFPPLPVDPISSEDFEVAIKRFTPSLRKEGFNVLPNVTWDQVGALEKARKQLKMSIIGPIKDPELYRSFGLTRPSGVLLWGPPGCGKTLVAQAVANEAQASFILINGPELLNKYVGESERAVRNLFQRARSSTPCILFFDEIDSLVPRRDNASTEAGARVVNALLTELDGAQDRSGVYVIGTTNRPDMIDAAMLRPGRLSISLFVDLPTPDERVDILKAIYRSNHTTTPVSDEELTRLDRVARDPRCKDFSGADLSGLHTKAAEASLGRWLMKEKTTQGIDDDDWEQALATTNRSVLNPETYRKLDTKLGKAM